MPGFMIGERGWESDEAILTFRLNGPPHVSLAVPGADSRELHALAASRARGLLNLGHAAAIQPLEVNGVTTGHSLAEASDPNIDAQWIHGRIAPPSLLDWLHASTPNLAPSTAILSQRGENQSMGSFLYELVGGERLFVRGAEKGLAAPEPGVCLLRPGWMTNGNFLSAAAAEIAWRDPRLLGWRAIPHGDGRVVFVIADQKPLVLDQKDWRFFGSQEPGKPLKLRSGGLGFAPLPEIAAALFGVAEPKETTLFPNAPAPPTPRLVSIFGRTWLAAETILIIRPEGLWEAQIVLAPPPSPRPPVREARFLPALVEEWTEGGGELLLKPRDERIWRMARGPQEPLRALCLTPAMSEERGGVYLRPMRGDPRIVQALSGEQPLALGAPMARDENLEEGNIDVALTGDGLLLSAAQKSAVFSLSEGLTETQARSVKIAGSVAVSGDLDVS